MPYFVFTILNFHSVSLSSNLLLRHLIYIFVSLCYQKNNKLNFQIFQREKMFEVFAILPHRNHEDGADKSVLLT